MAFPRKGDLLSGRYRIEELLGEGGMGRVYHANDVKTGTSVAVKVMKADASPGILKRFEREIATLRRLAHPDILGYIDHGRHAEIAYLVVELLVGHTLGEMRGEFAGQAERVLVLGARLARAFHAAHAAGVVHRDIKPANLFLLQTGEPRILDYGLARWVLPDGADPGEMPTIVGLTQSNAILGTMGYMAPEQLRTEPADARADVFSLGVVLYELATTQLPYRGTTMTELLDTIEDGQPERLSRHAPELDTPIGGALDGVLRKALNPLPHGRFRSMEDFAVALDRGRSLGSTLSEDASIALILPPEPTHLERHPAALRGRESEMAAMIDVLEADSRIALVVGPTGIGKSLLVNEFARQAHRRGRLCLTASVPRGSDEEGEPPVSSWLRQAAAAFPTNTEIALAGASSPEPTATSEPALRPRRQRVISAFAAVASRMPLVLVLDDLHFAGVELLRTLQRIGAAALAMDLTLVMTVRSDAVLPAENREALEALVGLPGMTRIEPGPLGAEDLAGLLGECYPGLELDEATLDELARKSGGNPSFARGILRLLEERGSLRRDGADWRLDGLDALPDSPEARAAMDLRLGGMPDEDRELLAAAAVIGQRFTPARLAEVLERDPASVEAALRGMDGGRKIVLRDGDGYAFDQALTREMLLDNVGPTQRKSLHARTAVTLARKIESGSSAHDVQVVASHYLEAGLRDDALPYVLRTARELRAQSAPNEAAPWYERSLELIEQRLSGSAPDRDVLRGELVGVELELGECLQSIGRSKEALEHLDRARGLAADSEQTGLQARALIGVSRSFLVRGDLLQAQRKAREAERVARRGSLETERALALSAEANALSRSGELPEAEDKWNEAAETLESQGRHAEAAEVWFRLANHHFRLDRPDDAERFYRKAAERADDTENPRLYARIKNGLGAVTLARGAPAAALVYFNEAREVRRRIGARHGEAASLHNIAYCHHLMGRFDEAKAGCREVLELRSASGDVAGYASAQRNYAEVFRDAGELEAALEQVEEALATKREIEDMGYVPHCLILVGEIELEIGRAERARAALREILRDFPDARQWIFVATLGMARLAWLQGDVAELDRQLRALDEHLDRRGGSVGDDPSPGYWLTVFARDRGADAEELRALLERVGTTDPSTEYPRTRILDRLAESIVLAAEGKTDDARSGLEVALGVATEVGYPAWIWRIRSELARLADDESAAHVHWSAAAETIRLQEATFRREGLADAYRSHRERAEILARVPDATDD